jgi:SAM-dependent methyltransferase
MPRVQASFRDPSGYVFDREGHLLRAINAEFRAVWDELCQNGLMAKLTSERSLVRTSLVADLLRAALTAEHPGFESFLEHERIEPITYPYEWSASMLADAGIHTLDLQMRLLERSYSLKDASAYNIQFVEGRPVFIDVTSIEHPLRLDLWFALGQFQRMFLYPLMLHRCRGWDLRSYFLPSLDGRNLEQVRQSLGRLALWRPSLLFDVTLPLLLERRENKRQAAHSRVAGSDASPGRADGHSSEAPLAGPAGAGPAQTAPTGGSSQAQVFTLKRLRGKVAKLAAALQPRSEWTGYTETCTYDQTAENAKKALVREFLLAHRPGQVLDLGCNQGDYSFIAAECGARVLAADSDPEVIEQLYRRLRQNPRPITPVVLDLGNPSPAIGLRNEERTRFLDRAQSDCLLALALVHHLLVSANLPLEGIRDLFCDLTRSHAVVEFVPTHDPMFQRLLKFRVNLFEGLTLEAFHTTFLQRFEILRQAAIPNSPRTLFFLRKR